MGGLFGSSKPATYTPPTPSAPTEEATFTPGGEGETDSEIKKRKLGKKILQIPKGTTTTAATGSGLSTGV